MSNDVLKSGVQLLQPWTNDEGLLLGSFTRQGEKWWTVYWRDAGTLAHPEKDLTDAMNADA